MMHDALLLGCWDQYETDALVLTPIRSSFPVLTYDIYETGRAVFDGDGSSFFIGDDGGDGDEVPEDVEREAF